VEVFGWLTINEAAHAQAFFDSKVESGIGDVSGNKLNCSQNII